MPTQMALQVYNQTPEAMARLVKEAYGVDVTF